MKATFFSYDQGFLKAMGQLGLLITVDEIKYVNLNF